MGVSSSALAGSGQIVLSSEGRAVVVFNTSTAVDGVAGPVRILGVVEQELFAAREGVPWETFMHGWKEIERDATRQSPIDRPRFVTTKH